MSLLYHELKHNSSTIYSKLSIKFEKYTPN
nr:MAG TPA: hypothetical protein [Caudoviricetes sp.]